MSSVHHLDVEAELSVLDALTAPTISIPKNHHSQFNSEMDPLLLAAAISCGPHVTRNHYTHDFFPAVGDPRAPGAWDWTKWTGEDTSSKQLDPSKSHYVSRQAPRSQRLRAVGLPVDDIESSSIVSVTPEWLGLPFSSELEVKCMARTRIPTPHGPAFLHLYHNNRDQKEHLAIVVDPAQLSGQDVDEFSAIRSRSLDAVWSVGESAMERITRGAYVGRLSPTVQTPSPPPVASANARAGAGNDDFNIPAPLVRIHSECFTGETIGSMRCDCGEQLDEAIRLISQPIPITSSVPGVPSRTIPGRGVVVYMRQEGRGIGLLSKIRAYNLQDLGHDTVTANIMLGHEADERGYEIAAAILKDLGMGSGQGVRLLTNNPDKVAALQKEGLTIDERVPMIPRSWKKHEEHVREKMVMSGFRGTDGVGGVTLVGGAAVHGEDLDKYLRTKVLKMGHLLPLFGHDGLERGVADSDGIVVV